MMRVQGTMSHLQDNQARLLVQQEPSNLILDKQIVMMRVLGIMLAPPLRLVKPNVRQDLPPLEPDLPVL